MKKIISFLLITLLLVGCTQEPFKLNKDYYGKSEIINITSDELKELEENKESFAVLTYTPGCMACAEFEEVLKQYSESNEITFYSISIEELKNTDIFETVKYTPSLVIFKKGKIISYLDSTKDSDIDYYKSTEKFNEWFTKYVKIEIE